MVLPLLMLGATAAAGAGNVIGGIMGYNAQEDANQTNYAIALMNYYQREKERRDAINEAQRQRSEAHQGMTDASGNRVYWVPGKGWVTELSPESKTRQQQYSTEETQQLAHDLPLKRAQMDKNIQRQGREDDRATAIMQEMMRDYRGDPRGVVGRRNLMSAEGITEGMDRTLNDAMANALRTGSSNAGDIASQIGRAKSAELRKAFMENAETANNDTEQDAYVRRQANRGQLYNMFATRASAMPDAPYNPRDIAGAANTALNNSMQRGDTAAGSLLNAFGKQGGTLQYKQEPNMGMANTIAQLGQTIGGAANYMDASRGGGYNSSDYYRQNVGPW